MDSWQFPVHPRQQTEMREVCVINVQELTQWCVQLLLTNAVPNGMIGFCRPPVCVPWTYRQVNQHSLAPSNKLSVCNTELWLFYNTFICRERISHWRNWLHGEFQTRFCLFCLYLIYVRFITRESRMSEASLPSSGRLSVRPSHSWAVSKRCKLGSRNLYRGLPQGL